MTKLGQEIRRRRHAKGLSQKQAADRCELDQSVFSRLESGKIKVPSDETRQKIQKGLEIAPGDFETWLEQAGGNTPPDLRVAFPHALTSAPLAALVMRGPSTGPWKLTSFGPLCPTLEPYWHDARRGSKVRPGPRFTANTPNLDESEHLPHEDAAKIRAFTASELIRLANTDQIECLIAASSALQSLTESENALPCARITTAYGHGTLLLAYPSKAVERGNGCVKFPESRPDWKLIEGQSKLVTLYGVSTIAERNILDLAEHQAKRLNPEPIDVGDWPKALKKIIAYLEQGKSVLFIGWDPLTLSLKERVESANFQVHYAYYLSESGRDRNCYAAYDFMMVNRRRFHSSKTLQDVKDFVHVLRSCVTDLNRAIADGNVRAQVICDVAVYFGITAEECFPRLAMMRFDLLYYPAWVEFMNDYSHLKENRL